jgi:hypothetical protein
MNSLTVLLQLAAASQLGVAVLNLFLIRLMRWREELARNPLLMHEVFQVHVWFISITLAIFGVMTWRFASEMAGAQNELAEWLATAIGLFWAIRTVLQVVYYSSSHWRGQAGRTIAHVTLLVMYGGMAVVYLWAALGGKVGGR